MRPIAADAESNFTQNSEQYDVIFLIDNDVDERRAEAACTVGTRFRHRGCFVNYIFIEILIDNKFTNIKF